MKKILSALLALVMLVSAVAMTACNGSTETEAPTEAPTEEATEAPEVIPETPYPVDRLTVAGNAIDEYVIVRNPGGGDAVTYAANELQKYIELTCGVKLEIVDSAEAGTKRFLLDETAYDNSTDNFKYFSDEDGITLQGSAKRGIIYSVYNFLENQLGWRFFAADCETCKEVSKIDLANVSCDYEFVYEIRDIYWTEYFDNTISLKRYQNGDGKRRGIIGGTEGFHPYGIHTFGALSGCSESQQPCLNDEDTYQRMFNTAKDWLTSTGSKAIHVSQNDNYNYCKCEKCQADLDYYGSPAGSIIKLVNRMDEDLKATGLTDITIITFAYAYSFPCPQNITCNDDIAIEICTINNCYNHAFNDASCPTNADCMKQYDAWSKLCDEFYIWDYTVNFKYYLSPFANFDVLRENIQYLGNIGAKGILEQGNYQTGSSGEFAALRCYLIAKVLENPGMTKEEYYAHMDEFLEAYYGAGWTNIRKFIDLITDMSNEKNFCFNIYTSPEDTYGSHAFEPYNEILLEWWDNAEAAAADDPVQLTHVRRSRICCDYLRLGAIHHQAYDAVDEMEKAVAEFHASLFELGVTRLAENFPVPEKVKRDRNPRQWWMMHEYKD